MARRGGSGRPDAADAAADDLYGRPLNEFTAARGERAKQARADGDGEGATAIGKLAKPNKVAWLANQLVRAHPDEVRSLLELGDSLRHATASLDAERLRRDSRQQHLLISALLQQAQILANAAGQAMSASTARGLEDTLHSALADEQAARQLSQGRAHLRPVPQRVPRHRRQHRARCCRSRGRREASSARQADRGGPGGGSR